MQRKFTNNEICKNSTKIKGDTMFANIQVKLKNITYFKTILTRISTLTVRFST